MRLGKWDSKFADAPVEPRYRPKRTKTLQNALGVVERRGIKMSDPCVICKTFDGYNKTTKTIALQSTKYGPVCPKCVTMMVAHYEATKDMVKELMGVIEGLPLSVLDEGDGLRRGALFANKAKYLYIYGERHNGVEEE